MIKIEQAVQQSPAEIDAHVSRRLRERRQMMGLTQADLGRVLDVSFQQVQKYERGKNRLRDCLGMLRVGPSGLFRHRCVGCSPRCFQHRSAHSLLAVAKNPSTALNRRIPKQSLSAGALFVAAHTLCVAPGWFYEGL